MGLGKLFSCFKKQPADATARQVDEIMPAVPAGESTPILHSQPGATQVTRPANAKPEPAVAFGSSYLAFNTCKAQSSRGGENGTSAGCDTADPSARK